MGASETAVDARDNLDIAHLPAVLTVEEVASLLRTTPRQVYRMAERGELRGVRLGRWLRVTRRDLLTFLDGGEKSAP